AVVGTGGVAIGVAIAAVVVVGGTAVGEGRGSAPGGFGRSGDLEAVAAVSPVENPRRPSSRVTIAPYNTTAARAKPVHVDARRRAARRGAEGATTPSFSVLGPTLHGSRAAPAVPRNSPSQSAHADLSPNERSALPKAWMEGNRFAGSRLIARSTISSNSGGSDSRISLGAFTGAVTMACIMS